MKRKGIFTYLLVLTMLAGLMTACGKKAEDVSESVAEESVEVVNESETKETKPAITDISFTDADTGITVEGTADAAALTVADVESEVNDNIREFAGNDMDKDVTAVLSYDISIADADGTAVQPEGEITVTIPVSEELKAAEGDAYAVYYFNPEDNSVQNMDCSASEDSVTFKTTHFSIYSVVKFTDHAMEPEPVQSTEGTAGAPEKVEESAPAAANLPGENRNGRYADIPESVMPSDSQDWYFWDEPKPLYTWYDDKIVADVYSDYERTQVIASFTYPEYDETGLLLIAEQGDTGRGIVIYNNQYAIVYYDMLTTNPGPDDR